MRFQIDLRMRTVPGKIIEASNITMVSELMSIRSPRKFRTIMICLLNQAQSVVIFPFSDDAS